MSSRVTQGGADVLVFAHGSIAQICALAACLIPISH